MNLRLVYYPNDPLDCPNSALSLYLTNKYEYRKVIFDLASEHKLLRFYENDQPISYRNIQVITDVFAFDINSSDTLQKIIKIMIKSLEQIQINEIQKLNQDLNRILFNEISGWQIPLSFRNELDISSLLDSKDLKIDMFEWTDVLDKVVGIIEIIAELKLASLIIIAGLNSIFNLEDIQEIIDVAHAKNVKIILIDNTRILGGDFHGLSRFAIDADGFMYEY
ncbi:type II-A CRISPR-associated protein Csn2 [Bombilactobacillus bombi]|uniref:type II-A CRISPR-associated protein Csn2 n=1 Tax=Bombilactobacillus bombi TaxID=1303590 RepID=UPI0015E5D1D1|nr:type II-A CRISPR-associated protein Csn2 [Bombilactobacillus bombi]MBA1434272.1 type II-A CRISPR-associated protein Csn2 [Bombilactobacillus bombi]